MTSLFSQILQTIENNQVNSNIKLLKV